MDRSDELNLVTSSCPQERATTFIKSAVAPKKVPNCFADDSIINLLLRFSFWVAIPTGQLLLPQARIPRQPMACNAEFETATASAPIIIALAKSSGNRRPPVMIKVTSLAPTASKCFRARARAGIVGTLMLSLSMVGAEPVPPPRPSKMI